jgi:rhomboid protease GluP
MAGLDDLQPLELDYSAFMDAPDPVSGKVPVAAATGRSMAPASGQVPAVAAKPRINPIQRIQYNAPVTLTFALLSLAVLGLSLIPGLNTNYWFSISRGSWFSPITYLRLFTHVLGHANWQHYIGNMMMILLLGPILEEKYGSGRLALMIAITAVVTGLLHILFTPVGLLGASGVVFMMILLASITNMEQGRIPLTLILILILYVGQEVVTWVTTDTNIAHSAHIIGGLCGAAFGLLVGQRKPRAQQAAGSRKASKLDRQAAKSLAKGRQI